MPKNKKCRKNKTPRTSFADQTEQQATGTQPLTEDAYGYKIWIDDTANDVARGLGITDNDIKQMIRLIEGQGFYKNPIAPNVYRATIAIKDRGLGKMATRSVIASKKDDRYFIIDFYAKSKKVYPNDIEIERYANTANKYLSYNVDELLQAEKTGALRRII